MKISDIDMGIASLWSGEEYECEKTGIKLTKFTPKNGEKNVFIHIIMYLMVLEITIFQNKCLI